MLTPPGSRESKGVLRRRRSAKPVRFTTVRRRRHRRRTLLGLTSVLLAGALAWGTIQLFSVWTSGEAEAARVEAADRRAACLAADRAAEARRQREAKAAVAKLPAPRQVSVRVLNATKRAGLAKSVADELKRRGFKVTEIGNAPEALDGRVDGAARVLAGLEGGEQGRVLAARIATAPAAPADSGKRALGEGKTGAPRAETPRVKAPSGDPLKPLTGTDARGGTVVDLVLGTAWAGLTDEPSAVRTLAAAQQVTDKGDRDKQANTAKHTETTRPSGC